MNRTLFICKPDAVERGLVGEIVARLERKGLRLAAADLRTIDADTAGRQYEEHRDQPFFPKLVELITRGPALVLVVEGPPDTWRIVRAMIGATQPAEAAPGTIRGDLAVSVPDNLVHGSDSAATAEREIALFFPGLSVPAHSPGLADS